MVKIEDKAEKPELPSMVILISGSGSNLQAIIDAVNKGEIEAEIKAVISNKVDAYGLERATKAGIKTTVIDHTQYDSRDAFDAQLMRNIEKHSPDLVVLAGFMRILTADFVKRYQGRMLNIHPSLLPLYQGLNTHQRALDAGDREHGVTVHFVTEDLDGGPNIIQAKVSITSNDNAESLQQKVLQQEHVIYPIAIRWFVQGRLSMDKGRALLDKEVLPETGLILESPPTLH